MDKLVEQIKKDKNRNIKDYSIQYYTKDINRLYNKIFNTDYDDINRLKRFSKIQKFLETQNTYTKRNYLVAILVSIKAYNFSNYIIKKYSDYFEKISVEVEEKNNNKSVDEVNWADKDFFDKAYKNLEDKIKKIDYNNLRPIDKDLLQQKLIFLLYTRIPPLRNDYTNTIVINKYTDDLDKKYNYMVLDDMLFILNNYKTDKIYGTKKIPVPIEVIKYIKEWMKYNKSKYLLIYTRKDEPMKPEGITKTLKRIFKPKKIGTSMMRKIYLSQKYSNKQKEMIKDADIMGHSVSVQQKIYVKNI